MNNLRAHLSKLQKPPAASVVSKASKEGGRTHKSKSKAPPEWNDTSVGDILPHYMVAEDKFASGYMAGLKR